MVPFGFMIDCRLASCPTRRSPFSVKATTDGVVRAPSALAITTGSPPCQAAITEFVVPRSMPTAVAIVHSLQLSLVRFCSAQSGYLNFGGDDTHQNRGVSLVEDFQGRRQALLVSHAPKRASLIRSHTKSLAIRSECRVRLEGPKLRPRFVLAAPQGEHAVGNRS